MTNESPGFNGFCGDYFFDYNATINADSPTLSKCFEHTVLTWVPVLCLLCILPFQILFCTKSKALPLLFTTLLLAKYVIQMCLVLVTLVHWIYCVTKYMNNSTIISADDFVAPLLINFSMILLFGIIISCRFKGLVTSGVFFISIFLFLLCGIPEFLTQINTISRQSDVEYEMPASCFIIYFCLLFIQWILSFFADKPAYYRSVGSAEKVCPEKLSSFFNRISFWWFSSMTVTGWKRSLTRDDLWLLNEEDSSEELVKTWEKLWLPRVRRFFQRKAATSKNATPDDSAKIENIQDGKVAFIDRQQQQPLTENSKKKNAKASTADNYPSLIWCLFLAYFHLIVPASILKTVADTIQFINPILLSLMIQFISTPEEPVWKGYFFALAMFFTSVIYTFLLHQYFHYMMRFGMNMRTVLVSSVFNKALKLSNSARKEKGTGETVNIMSTDVQRFQDAAFYVNLVISCPYQIIIAIYFLWKQLGPSVLAGVGVMILLIPINYVLSMFQRKLQVQQMKMKDDRIKLMNEILNGIKVLKLYAWEDSFEKQILQIRSKELSVLRKMNYLSAVTTLLWSCAPFLVSVVSFGVYILATDNSFTPQTAFVSLSLFNILRFPMTMFPMLVSYAVQASVSNRRLKEFLCAGEMDPTNVDRSMRGENAVKVENGTFSWGTAPKTVPTLHDLNCTVEKGKLVAVVGQVGSGKSSLLSAILGEMDKNDGYVGLNGSIAYIPQQAWIQNMTLKDNVTFGKPLSDKSYAEVIDSCALAADLEILPSGDMTEIGEKGINLSGGQKQRVSLARAVYQNSDIYLFDDPLSAVDSHVGRHIFDKVISNDGMLKDKTRILVTHGLGYLKNVDKIFVMTNGRITESGTYRELLSKRGAFAEILVTYLKEKEEGEVEDEEEDLEIGEVLHDLEEADPSVLKRLASELEPEEDLSHSPKRLLNRLLSSKEDFEFGRKSPPKKQSSIEPPFGKRQVSVKETPTKQAQFDKKKEDSKIIKEESTETGRVKMTVYNSYFKAMGYGAFVGCVLLTALSNIFGASSNLWLSRWSNQNDSLKNDFYLGIYASLGFSQAIFIFLAALLMTFATMAASKILHKNLLENLLRSPLTFYDITPLGRILNRCGKDVDVVDNTLANTIRSWIGCICNVFFTIITIIVAIYYFAIVVLPLTIMYFFALRFYVSTSRQLKRLESVSRSPIFSQFQETLNGASSIRAYCVQEKFVKDSERRVDENQACYYPNIVSNRWIAVRLEFIGNLMVLFAAIFGVLGRDTFNGGQVGLALSYSLSVTQVLNWAVRMTSDLETNIVAVERIKEYSETPTEAPWVTETRPKSGWPTVGSFTVDRFSLRYRTNLDLVLKEITCTIRGGEKVGIVGRTGAGKSSLTLALFRIVEPAGGKIVIDDVDITKIGLHDLRSRLTIIPQDPVLFSGTLRMNLDPFEKHSDDEIWTALEQAHLKHFVSEQTEKLFHKISEGGENLSVGQRQLICLARALLRKTKVLVLDEATAAVDLETDDLIQKTIRSYFSDCTIITIAHRLNTILDSNRVMVLSAGNIVEFESPEKLLNDPNSNFYSMAKDAGLV